jgi:hypothetical protein
LEANTANMGSNHFLHRGRAAYVGCYSCLELGSSDMVAV